MAFLLNFVYYIDYQIVMMLLKNGAQTRTASPKSKCKARQLLKFGTEHV